MPYCPDPIVRADFMARFAVASRHRGEFDVAGVLADLRSAMPLVDVARKHHLIEAEHSAEELHLRRDWYGGADGGWWPDHPVEDIVREAYVAAIEKSEELDKPVDAYWVPGEADSFRATMTTGLSQITLLFHTPPVPQPAASVDALVDDDAVCVIEVNGDGTVHRRCGRRLP
ncbi:MAG: hypothetical protein JRG76_17215 [Deltaproteobacteria bacterium]|nr:hypothetical protein [Deltaproteobacteria bacterium]MBW2416242.1 hypothetical protein [Deltaproteobacteria bacterium]